MRLCVFGKLIQKKPLGLKRSRYGNSSNHPLSLTNSMLEAIETQKLTDQWKRGVIPNPASWIRGRRWEDEVAGLPLKGGDYATSERGKKGGGLQYYRDDKGRLFAGVMRDRPAETSPKDGTIAERTSTAGPSRIGKDVQ